MRAVAIPGPGGPEVLKLVDRDPGKPGPGEVRIAVRAAAINPTDIGVRENGVEDVDPPWIPGMDAAGTVEAVGEGVERLSVGDEVMAVASPRRPEGGAQAELIVVREASAVPIPEGATLAEASTLPMNGLTALLGLDLLGLGEEESLAVTGGAGQLASYVIPIAKERGLRVIADAAEDDRELVRSFGADEVVERGENFGDLVRAIEPDGVDGVFDTALLRHDALGAIRDGGGIAVVRGWEGEQPDRDIKVHPVAVFSVLGRTDWLDELRGLASEGKLALRVAVEYPPEQAAQAQRDMDAGGLRGRAVLIFE